jgi:hypothetical protein
LLDHGDAIDDRIAGALTRKDTKLPTAQPGWLSVFELKPGIAALATEQRQHLVGKRHQVIIASSGVTLRVTTNNRA